MVTAPDLPSAPVARLISSCPAAGGS